MRVKVINYGRAIADLVKAPKGSVRLEEFGRRHPYPLSIQNFLDNAKNPNRIESFDFLRTEIPVRMAQVMMESDFLPEGLKATPCCNAVRENFARSFSEILEFQSMEKTPSVLDQFDQVLHNFKHLHLETVPLMAEATTVYSANHKITPEVKQRIQFYLERLYMTRIGINTIINQHLYMGSENNALGFLEEDFDVVRTLTESHEDAARIVSRHYDFAPELDLICVLVNEDGKLCISDSKSKVTLTNFPSNIFHVTFEIFKNAMEDICKHRGEWHDVKVRVSKIDKMLSIDIMDGSSGISDMENLFQFSLAPKTDNTDVLNGNSSVPLSGLGYGLAMSRLFTRYLGGELKISSAIGEGTTASLLYPVSPNDAVEKIPRFTKRIKKFYTSNELHKNPTNHSEIPFDGMLIWNGTSS